ncbi:DUF5818 domain-containing protein [Sphingobium agri]|uniref:DUF5818 domain-containing protein n=1 Tax=Sphingobium TaxID=165695 RepID=UPI001FF24FE9|nr:DUF5818 domain-containing protein [Sphingobium agri]
MPRGLCHVETGILRPGRWGCALETDGGGIWQLDAPRAARRYLGMRVKVEGRRSGFDLLDVHRISPIDPPIKQPLRRWRQLLGRFGLGRPLATGAST